MEESKDEPETAASTPSSQQASQTDVKSTKDRKCPFCARSFTTSSLGRHLDLYIKPKNPKAPDGQHDVEAIRKMRGGITRRQPKTNLRDGAKFNLSGWRQTSAEGTPTTASSGPPAPRKASESKEHSPALPQTTTRDSNAVRTTFNAPNWQATGVINNLPPRPPSRTQDATPTGQAQRIHEMRRNATGSKVPRPEYENDSTWKLQEAAEVGRSAELALREVLGSLEAAKKSVETEHIFEGVDFFSLSFAGLCLAILPAPTTLFCSTPFSTNDSWMLTPPDLRHLESLSNLIQKRTAKLCRSPGGGFPESVVSQHHSHLRSAYEHWQRMSESDQSSAWTLETLRAYATATDQKQQAQRELEATRHRVRHLEAEFDRLSRCQLPREYLLHPPNTMPAPAAILKEMQKTQLRSGVTEMDYDVDVLLSKWRTAVKATTRRSAPASTLNPSHEIYYDRPPPCALSSDILLNGAVFGVGGAIPRTVSGMAHDQSCVSYETPPEPGAVVGAEDDAEDEHEPDAEGEVDAGNGHAGQYASPVDRGALVMTSTGAATSEKDVQLGGTLNVNGKRPYAPTSTGRPKMYKENG